MFSLEYSVPYTTPLSQLLSQLLQHSCGGLLLRTSSKSLNIACLTQLPERANCLIASSQWASWLPWYSTTLCALAPSFPALLASCMWSATLLAGPMWMTYLTSGKLTPILRAEVAITIRTCPTLSLNEHYGTAPVDPCPLQNRGSHHYLRAHKGSRRLSRPLIQDSSVRVLFPWYKGNLT